MFSSMYSIAEQDTICALSTAPGMAAIAVIRISGEKTFEILSQCFTSHKKKLMLSEAPSHTLHLGWLGDDREMIDEVLVSVFRRPHSYTGEDVAEISCHGSVFIQQKLLELLIKKGIRLAKPGEFTLRAFMNGKFDLSQAEAVADLIASNSQSSHDLALKQMRGGFSGIIQQLRKQLIHMASLLELELDFSEEDVEFANRAQLNDLLQKMHEEFSSLIQSFSIGNVLKHGIPVAIVGKPNVGKSTLLNALLNEERAIVSEIPGTTRDTIEDVITIQGISFRFTDTAGLREISEDTIETMGIERTYEKVSQAAIILYVFDINEVSIDEIHDMINELKDQVDISDKRIILIANKTDMLMEAPHNFGELVERETIFVSAKRKENINLITESLLKSVAKDNTYDKAIVSNTRHYESLVKSLDSIDAAQIALAENVPSDLIAEDIRLALYHLGEITGEITTDEVLTNIFSNFCIGK